MAARKRMIDIGVNLTDPVFRGQYRGKQCHADDFPQILSRAKQVGVDKMIITGTTVAESKQARQLAHAHDGLYYTVGCHPTRCKEFEQDRKGQPRNPDEYLSALKDIITEELRRPDPRVVAIGEFGLDYDRLQFCPKDVQIRYYERQFELAEHFKLPLFLHNRNTGDDFVNITKKNRSRFTTGVVHSFTGTLEELHMLLSLDLYIGVNGCSMKTSENLEAVKAIPINRLMIETDAPYCDIKPAHASHKYLTPEISGLLPASKKKEKFELGSMVKGRNEPCQTV
ncbi:hypothetical protein DFS34DRAFT_658303 [Phlyctochytrium arcticum]|nr:hypothetical protein DFS34DRAFT_658303 [Phlyctochytrium arcticum]